MRQWVVFNLVMIVGSLGWAGKVLAVTPVVWEQLSQEARQAYDQGDYSQAIKKYEKLKIQGLENATLYYNLGNAQFKAGQIGWAIASYRAASKRAPGDEDIQYNLEYARKKVSQPMDRTGAITKLLVRWLNRFYGQTLVMVAWGVYCGWMVVMGWLLLKSHPRVVWKWTASSLGLIFLFIACWAAFKMLADNSVRWGVVVANQSEARNGPGIEYQVGFTVPEGREIRLLGQEGEWIAIGLPQEGHKGWVKAAAIAKDE